jgi:hypothetical protein
MDMQQQIAEVLHRSITWERGYAFAYRQPRPASYYLAPRPSAEDLGQQLLAVAEAEGLKLGTWLSTTDGETLTAAVEMVSPPFFREDVELLVDGLKFAAKLQQEKRQQEAGLVAIASLGLFMLLLVARSAAGKSA